MRRGRVSERDAELVRRLADQHLGHHRFPFGMRPEEVALNDTLKGSAVVVDCQPTMPLMREFFRRHGIEAGERYVDKFRGELLMMLMAADVRGESATVTVGMVATRIAERIEEEVTGKRREPAAPAPPSGRGGFHLAIACPARGRDDDD